MVVDYFNGRAMHHWPWLWRQSILIHGGYISSLGVVRKNVLKWTGNALSSLAVGWIDLMSVNAPVALAVGWIMSMDGDIPEALVVGGIDVMAG